LLAGPFHCAPLCAMLPPCALLPSPSAWPTTTLLLPRLPFLRSPLPLRYSRLCLLYLSRESLVVFTKMVPWNLHIAMCTGHMLYVFVSSAMCVLAANGVFV
jgi:hypothetical protein